MSDELYSHITSHEWKIKHEEENMHYRARRSFSFKANYFSQTLHSYFLLMAKLYQWSKGLETINADLACTLAFSNTVFHTSSICVMLLTYLRCSLL